MKLNSIKKEIIESNLEPKTKMFLIKKLEEKDGLNHEIVLKYLKHLGLAKDILERFGII